MFMLWTDSQDFYWNSSFSAIAIFCGTGLARDIPLEYRTISGGVHGKVLLLNS